MRRLLNRLRFLLPLGVILLASSARAQLTILSQPASLLNLLNLGQTVKLAVTATSASATNLVYQWKRNGVLIPGATNATLSLANAQATDCGAYTVQISDGLDSVETIPSKIIPGFLNQLLGSVLTLLDITGGQIRTSTDGVTNTAGIPDLIPGVAPTHPVVIHWTPLLGGTVTFNTLGSDFDTVLGVYTQSGGKYVPVPSAVNDDDSAGYLNSTLSFNANGLTTYCIILDGFRGASGDAVLSWTETLGNILKPKSFPTITAMPATATTVAPGAPANLSGLWGGANCAWLFDGQLTSVVNTNAFNVPSVGDSTVGNYVAQVSGVGGLFSDTRAASVQENILQDGTTATNSFAFNKFMQAASMPFAQPIPRQQHTKTGTGSDTRGYTCAQTFSTQGSRSEPGEPSICGQIGGSPQWYVYVAPQAGSLLIDTTGSSFNTMVGVYVGPGNSFSTLTNIGCGYTTNYTKYGQPLVSVLNVAAGQTNYIQVDGFHGASGTVHLNIHLGQPVNITAPPQNQTVATSTNVTFTAVATGATNMFYAWLFNGAPIAGATGPVLTITNVQSAAVGTYSVVISNMVSVEAASATLALQSPPTITIQPGTHTVARGSTTSMAVAASAYPPPSYQWTFNGQAVGTNSATLTIQNFQETNAGCYQVVVSNVSGTVTSSPALLLPDQPLHAHSLGIVNGQFQMRFVGSAGNSYLIQASTDLVNWTTVETNTAATGIIDWADSTTDSPHKFYRAIAQ